MTSLIPPPSLLPPSPHQVLQVLTSSGYRGPEVDVLLSLAADGDEQQGLLGQLSQADAQQLMVRLTDLMAVIKTGA